MRKVIDHAESDHKMQVLSADVIFTVQIAIKLMCLSFYFWMIIRPYIATDSLF